MQAARFQAPSPALDTGPYVMLPGITYAWRVRTTTATTPLREGDPDWSAYAEGSFRTYAPTSASVRAVSPAVGSTAASRTPTLQWTNADPYIFYYALQLSADAAFTTDPARAIAAVYEQLIHGGQTTPLNSWAVPAEAALEAGKIYFGRVVRPPVQGDGTPVAWSTTWSFGTQ